MAQALLYKVDSEKGVVFDFQPGDIETYRKAINCRTFDIAYVPNTKFLVVLDDEGMIANKPYKRGFFGDFFVMADAGEGDSRGLTDEEIEEVRKMFDTRENFQSTGNIELDALIRRAKLPVVTFSYSKDDANFGYMFVCLSTMDILAGVIEEIRAKTRDPQTNMSIKGFIWYLIDMFKDSEKLPAGRQRKVFLMEQFKELVETSQDVKCSVEWIEDLEDADDK